MNFIEEMKKRARTDIKTIVLPEAEDKRVLEAASKVEKEAFAKIILIGNIEKTKELAKENNIDITNIDVPAIVVIFFKGFIPLVATNKPIKNTAKQATWSTTGFILLTTLDW